MTGDRLFVGCILLGPLNSTSCLPFKCKIIADVFLLYFNVPADSFFCSTHHCRQGVSDNLVPGHRQTHLAHHMCSSCILREMLPNPRVGHCKAAEQKNGQLVDQSFGGGSTSRYQLFIAPGQLVVASLVSNRLEYLTLKNSQKGPYPSDPKVPKNGPK